MNIIDDWSAVEKRLEQEAMLFLEKVYGGEIDIPVKVNKKLTTTLGKQWFGFDPYNRPEKENKIALAQDVDLIACNNVLNVIESDEIIDQIVHDIAWMMPKYAVFCVYDGNGKGEGKESKKDCFQRHQKPVEYMPLLEKYFGNVVRKGNIFICN